MPRLEPKLVACYSQIGDKPVLNFSSCFTATVAIDFGMKLPLPVTHFFFDFMIGFVKISISNLVS